MKCQQTAVPRGDSPLVGPGIPHNAYPESYSKDCAYVAVGNGFRHVGRNFRHLNVNGAFHQHSLTNSVERGKRRVNS